MSREKTEIVSVYGQIEGVVADAMIAEGKVNKIDFDMMPPTQQYHDKTGEKAHCALVVSASTLREFNARVAALRA